MPSVSRKAKNRIRKTQSDASTGGAILKYFAMLRTYNNMPIPLIDDLDEIVLYDSRDDATKAAINNIIGSTYGFEIYEWGM